MRIKIVGLACVLAVSGALAVFAIARPHSTSRPATPAPSANVTTAANSLATTAISDSDPAASAFPAVQRVAANSAPDLRVAAPAAQAPESTSPSPSPVRSATPACSNPNALGVARVVEIDTKGGPGF